MSIRSVVSLRHPETLSVIGKSTSRAVPVHGAYLVHLKRKLLFRMLQQPSESEYLSAMIVSIRPWGIPVPLTCPRTPRPPDGLMTFVPVDVPSILHDNGDMCSSCDAFLLATCHVVLANE